MLKKHLVADFIPSKQYPRHSEGAFLRLKDGRILFVYSRYTGGVDDGASADLAAVYSADEGETWSEARPFILAAQYHTQNIMSVSLMRMQNGDLGCFYIVKAAAGVNRIMLSRSADEGESFYLHTECTLSDRAAYYVLNNDRVIRLQSGRILVPLAFHRGGYDQNAGMFFDGRGVACFVYSDDDGYTWQESPDVVFPPFTHSGTGLQETGVIEKENGVVWAYNRTDMHAQYEYFSFDGGLHWTVPQPSRFTSPCSPMNIRRHPKTGTLYAIWNPIPCYNGRKLSKAGWGRTPLVYAQSTDDGCTWSEYTVIEGDEESGYCYPAIFFTEDHAMLTAYCAGGAEDGICLARLHITKIPL